MRQSVASLRIVTILVAAVIGATMISACRTTTGPRAPGAMPSSWRMFGHDRAHTGQSSFDTSANPGAQKWRFSTGGRVASPAIGTDSTIYFGSDDGNLYAVGGARR